MTTNKNSPYPEEIATAKSNPNGWVYRIKPGYSETERVPPEAIVGAWKVDSKGNITGDFIMNEKYAPDETAHETEDEDKALQ